jgi:hypothetical protein
MRTIKNSYDKHLTDVARAQHNEACYRLLKQTSITCETEKLFEKASEQHYPQTDACAVIDDDMSGSRIML